MTAFCKEFVDAVHSPDRLFLNLCLIVFFTVNDFAVFPVAVVGYAVFSGRHDYISVRRGLDRSSFRFNDLFGFSARLLVIFHEFKFSVIATVRDIVGKEVFFRHDVSFRLRYCRFCRVADKKFIEEHRRFPVEFVNRLKRYDIFSG
ncbi:hypothetical protein SDC9_208371 [bioreactor metagenome]|uniref:Uncharacterized protein n=1 Tax=bioreactor metagenome TaxID=1076179 RepID=A0A645JBW2_9ZZZZ